MSLTYDEIAEIIKLIDSSSCDELVIETEDMKLVVRRNGAPAAPAAEYTERGSSPTKVVPISAPAAAVSTVEAAAGQIARSDEGQGPEDERVPEHPEQCPPFQRRAKV